MEGYIREVLAKYGHPMPKKRQISPHKHSNIVYGAKQQFTPDKYTSPNLDLAGIWCVQGIVGALLYYACVVDNKLIMDINDIGIHQAATTECTAASINQLLGYVVTYPNYCIIFRASDMIMCRHSDAAYINSSKACSLSVSFILLLEYDPIPRLIGPVLTLSQIIKFLMSSADEAEMEGLFITSKNMIPLRQNLIEMS